MLDEEMLAHQTIKIEIHLLFYLSKLDYIPKKNWFFGSKYSVKCNITKYTFLAHLCATGGIICLLSSVGRASAS